jgi:ABC-2 type transport system permease protein
VRPYLALARISARTALAYRLNFALGMFGLFFQLIAMFAIWSVLLRSGANMAGFTLPQMKAYLLIAFTTGVLVSLTSDFGMAGRVLDGSVALDLTKPVSYQHARFSTVLGTAAVEFVLGAVMSVIVATFAGPVAGPSQVGLFLVSLLPVVPIKFALVYFTSLLCFYTQNYLGILWAREAIVGLMAGAVIPLVFLPAWLQWLANVLPFAGITSTPALIYLGRAAGADALRLIAVQVLWAVALWFAARLAWRFAVRKLTVHGG